MIAGMMSVREQNFPRPRPRSRKKEIGKSNEIILPPDIWPGRSKWLFIVPAPPRFIGHSRCFSAPISTFSRGERRRDRGRVIPFRKPPPKDQFRDTRTKRIHAVLKGVK